MVVMRPIRSSTAAGGLISGSIAAILALLVGLAFAAVSAYWAAGGHAGIDTVGGVFAEAGQSGGDLVAAGLWMVVAIKVLAAVLPLVTVMRGRARARWWRVVCWLAWIDAVILTVYGLVMTIAGLLVQAGVLHASPDADHRALAWHAYLWDPWFLLWGLLAMTALVRRRREDGRLATPPDAELTAHARSAR